MFGHYRHGRHHGRHQEGRHAHGGFERGERGGRFGRGARLGRFFDHGDLRLVILQLVAEKPRHGYEVIKAIEEKVAGAYSPSPGVVYPTLTLLEELGYVTVAAAEAGRKLYTITPEGEAYLQANAAAVGAISARIDEVGATRGGPAPQIMRAMHNLKLALRMKMSSGAVSPEEVARIVTLLDQAARDVEAG
jgi:DNA-binding PadR family transcriptional regulator